MANDKGNLVFARRSWNNKAARAKRRKTAIFTCYNCAKVDKTGLFNGLCTECYIQSNSRPLIEIESETLSQVADEVALTGYPLPSLA